MRNIEFGGDFGGVTMARHGSDDWKTAKLGDVIDLFDSQRVPLNSRQRQERQGRYPYYGAQGIIDHIDGYIFDGLYILVAEDGENLNSKKLPLALFAEGKFWVNNHAHVLRGKPEVADDTFLLACLNNADIKPFVTGAAQPKLSQANLRQIEIPLPPLPVQRRIAGILSAYDELIENSQRRIRILEAMARALYREWFVHFRYPGHENVPMVRPPSCPGVASAKTDGEIPKGWEATTLGEFVSRGGVTLQTGPFGTQLKAAHYTGQGTPVVNVRNIGFGSLRDDKLEFLPPERVEENKRHKLQEGDIVFGRKGAVERHLLVSPSENGWIQGSDCIRLRVESGPLKPRFLSVAFREGEHQRWMMNQCSGGATMASLNQDILCRIPIVLPPPQLIELFDSFAAAALNQGDVFSAQIQNLRRARDLLLPRLMSGQVNLEEN